MPVLPVQFICAKCQEDSDKILGLTFDQWPVKE